MTAYLCFSDIPVMVCFPAFLYSLHSTLHEVGAIERFPNANDLTKIENKIMNPVILF